MDVLYPGCLYDESEDAREKLLKKHINRNTAQAPWRSGKPWRLTRVRTYVHSCHSPEGAIGWVYKILALEKETERLLFNDPTEDAGFLLNTDQKWTTHLTTTRRPGGMEQARVHEGPVLPGTVSQEGCQVFAGPAEGAPPDAEGHGRDGQEEVIRETYGLEDHSVRVFVHYPPQFYHFHVHYTNVAVDIGVQTERAHLLDDVIDNIERDSEHYAKCAITGRMGENDELFRRYREWRGQVTVTPQGARDRSDEDAQGSSRAGSFVDKPIAVYFKSLLLVNCTPLS